MRRIPHSPASALATVALLYGLVAAGPLHLVLDHHELCPEHGELVHGDGSPAQLDDDDTHGRLPADGSVPHGHDRDRCDYALILGAPGEPAPPSTSLALERKTALAELHFRISGAPQPIATLSLAPNHSPPVI